MRVFVGATEYPGHAFPEFGLARALHQRGHEVTVATAERWRGVVSATGPRVLSVEQLRGVTHHGTFDEDLVEAVRALVPVLEELGPAVVVSDLATAAPPLAAELAGIPRATVLATVFPVEQAGMPFYGVGARPPRTALGAALWRGGGGAVRALRPHQRRLRSVAAQLDRARRELGLGPHGLGLDSLTAYGSISEELALVATFPQLEYPRRWPAGVQVTGPMLFEPSSAEAEPPPGDDPLVVVVGSTAQDPGLELVRTTVAALAEEPVRVLATASGHSAGRLDAVPDNARVVDWLPLERQLSSASLLITRGGHGTVVRSLASGVPLLVCPADGDMPENAARVAWAGAGLRLPRRLLGRRTLRAAARRLLSEPRFAARAREIARWTGSNDGSVRGAELVEELARVR